MLWQRQQLTGEANRNCPPGAILWWIQPVLTVGVLGAFGIYAFWAGVIAQTGHVIEPYLSPFYSPLIITEWWPLSPALLVMWATLFFRVTCYYYRKSYYRGVFLGSSSVYGWRAARNQRKLWRGDPIPLHPAESASVPVVGFERSPALPLVRHDKGVFLSRGIRYRGWIGHLARKRDPVVRLQPFLPLVPPHYRRQ